jgi:hypothetical protein
MFVVTYRLSDIKLDERGLYATLKSQRSPVADHIRSIGRQTVIEAKMLAGVKTGRLKRSIKMERDRTVTGEYAVLVGSDVRHALVHHQGARPHEITPQSAGGRLVFMGKYGRVVTTHVDHKGHSANKYLVNALRMVIER